LIGPKFIVYPRLYLVYVTTRSKGDRIVEEGGFREEDAPVKLWWSFSDAARSIKATRKPEILFVTVPPGIYLDLRGLRTRPKEMAWKDIVCGVVYGPVGGEAEPNRVVYIDWEDVKPFSLPIYD
jgi:hypothetical protein